MRAALPLALIALASCNSPDRSLNVQLLPGEMVYRASSSSGLPILEGRITFTVVGDSLVSGEWVIGWAPGADTTRPVGPQVGSGRLAGSRVDDGFAINLNPGWADNNVFLLARPANGGWQGEWSWSTIVGPVEHGTFTASDGPDAPDSTVRLTAVVTWTNIEGGCWTLNAGQARYQPIDLPEAYRVDGLTVAVVLRRAAYATSCMAGLPVTVESITRP